MLKMPSFCQDRLGTNIGKALKRDTRCCRCVIGNEWQVMQLCIMLGQKNGANLTEMTSCVRESATQTKPLSLSQSHSPPSLPLRLPSPPPVPSGGKRSGLGCWVII
eukprot:COSAG06_NODE_5541_length_3416_cov_5.780525_6_plen_106_part_00